MSLLVQVNSLKQKHLERTVVTMFPHIGKPLTKKLEEDHQQAITGIHREHQVVITDAGNQISVIQHENVGLQDEIQAKNQLIAALKRHYVATYSGNHPE